MTDPFYHDSALYDAMYADVHGDVPVLIELMREAGGPVLEVCCGNGRVLVPAREQGLVVDGLDLSKEMLEGLRSKLAARGLAAGVHAGDMTTFSLPGRYALVLIAFNSFLHNLTQADQIATLRRCREHLAPGGSLALVVFHPAADKLIEWAAGEKLVKDIPNATGPGRVRVTDITSDDRIEQVRRVRRRVEFVDEAGRVTRTEPAPFVLRYVFKPEMELLLRVAGFSRWDAKPLEHDAADRISIAARPAREGDILLWRAWAGA